MWISCIRCAWKEQFTPNVAWIRNVACNALSMSNHCNSAFIMGALCKCLFMLLKRCYNNLTTNWHWKYVAYDISLFTLPWTVSWWSRCYFKSYHILSSDVSIRWTICFAAFGVPEVKNFWHIHSRCSCGTFSLCDCHREIHITIIYSHRAHCFWNTTPLPEVEVWRYLHRFKVHVCVWV